MDCIDQRVVSSPLYDKYSLHAMFYVVVRMYGEYRFAKWQTTVSVLNGM